MTIRNKILTGFLGMSLILTIMGLFGLHSVAESGRLVVDTFDRPQMAMSHARAAMADFYAIQGALVRMDHAATAAEINAQADQIDRLMKDLRDDLKIARSRAHSPEIVAAVDRASGLLQAWVEARRRTTRAPKACIHAPLLGSVGIGDRRLQSSSPSPSPSLATWRSMPSSLILRVKVLRPQPSNSAASRRRPAVWRSATSSMTRSNAGRAHSSKPRSPCSSA